MEMEQRDTESSPSETFVKSEAEEEASGHVCGVCARSFPLLSSLSQHMRRHTREKPYKCPYCEHRTAQKGSLKAHIRSHKLGLLSHSLGGKVELPHLGQKEDGEVKSPDAAVQSIDSSCEKGHNVNGKVKKKGSKKKVKGKDTEANGEDTSRSDKQVSEQGDVTEVQSFACSLCSQVFPQALLLKAHMKKHRGSQDHGCRICGRRFRQAWFLQSHMRIHRAKAQLRSGNDNDPPATINGAPQDPASLTSEECLYELCAGCGNFFYDRKALRAHERLHNKSHSRPCQSQKQNQLETSELFTSKTCFLQSLNLRCVDSEEIPEDLIPAQRIPELDPVCSYQAWQLATKGRLVEATEKGLGWEERLADADVVYNKEKGEYVALKQEKKRKQTDTSGPTMKKKKGSVSHPSSTLTNTNGGSTGIHQSVLFNGLGHAFYGALQKKKSNEVSHSTKQTNNIRNKVQEDKKSCCEHCDYRTVDASSLRSHMREQHHEIMGPYSKPSNTLDNLRHSGYKASKYMDYLRNRSALLSQPFWSPYTCLPSQEWTESSKDKSQAPEVKGQRDTAVDGTNLLNLSALSVDEANQVKEEGLVKHQCPYCSHTSNYPEVLWIHQRVAHRVDSASSMAPKWAPCTNRSKAFSTGGGPWRRTGPPPFLEGKDCPALPTPRTQRTHHPGSTAHSSSSSSGSSSGKCSASKSHPGNPTNKPKPSMQSKDSHTVDAMLSSKRMPLMPQKKRVGEQNQSQEGGSKGPNAEVISSSSSAYSISTPGFSTNSSKHRSNRVSVEGKLLPQEGLGFILARSHGRSPSHTSTEGVHAHSQTRDSSAGPKGADLWSSMNLWGIHRGRTYLEQTLFAQGKTESRGEMPMDIDVLSLLKNYNPHDLAALYQHWGFADPRHDPRAMLQLNGNFGSEGHSSSEASKQVNSHSTSSSGTLSKGT